MKWAHTVSFIGFVVLGTGLVACDYDVQDRWTESMAEIIDEEEENCTTIDCFGDERFELVLDPFSVWDAGACYRGYVTNVSDETAPWEVAVELGGQIFKLWGAKVENGEGYFVFIGDGWNIELGPGGEHEFGFCKRG